MRIFKKFMLSIMIVVSTLSFMVSTVPGVQQTFETQATCIKISKTNKTLHAGERCTLSITGTKKKASWTSSNKTVATVNSNGMVIAKKKGTATITAKVGNKKYKCIVTVKQHTTSSTVYITNTGKKYHKSTCSCLRKSKIKISLSNAKKRGYTACKRCH